MRKRSRQVRLFLALFTIGVLASSGGMAVGRALAAKRATSLAGRHAVTALKTPGRRPRTGWRTFRDTAAGYAVNYPSSWSAVRQTGVGGALTTVFVPSNGGTGITITVRMQGAAHKTSDVPTGSDTPNERCRPVRQSGLTGTRCFDTLSFSTSTTFTGTDRAYTISTGRRGNIRVYDRLLQSFRPIG